MTCAVWGAGMCRVPWGELRRRAACRQVCVGAVGQSGCESCQAQAQEAAWPQAASC